MPPHLQSPLRSIGTVFGFLPYAPIFLDRTIYFQICGMLANPKLNKPIFLRSNPTIDHTFSNEQISIFTAMTGQKRTCQDSIRCWTNLIFFSSFHIDSLYPHEVPMRCDPPIFLVKKKQPTKAHTTHSVVVISDATEAASARALRTTRVGSWGQAS